MNLRSLNTAPPFFFRKSNNSLYGSYKPNFKEDDSMKEFIGFVKGFAAAIWLVIGALLAIIGYACGVFTSAGLEAEKPKSKVKPDYSRVGR